MRFEQWERRLGSRITLHARAPFEWGRFDCCLFPADCVWALTQKDPAKTWQDWMVREQAIPSAPACDAGALARNAEMGRKHKITGTPTLFFIDGTRAPGALDVKQVEKLLTEAKG